MSQPTPYTPNADFSQQEANNASGRSTVNTAALDAEFAAIESTLDQTLNNIHLLQRDDGRLGDLLVEIRCLSQDVLNVMGGFNLRGLWTAATNYAVNDICSNGAYTYVCKTAHLSGGSIDLANWIQFGFTSGADAAQAAADAQNSRDSATISKDAAALSAANAAISAGAASTSASNASTSASVASSASGNASSSATAASNSAAAAAASAASMSSPISVASGGTGGTTVSAAKINLSLNNVSNTSDAEKPVSTAQQTALNLKANIAGPTFTGVPTAPTAAAGTNTTQIATTAFVWGEFPNSLSTSGYQKLTGGLIIQWGLLSSPGNSGTISYPISFPSQSLSVAFGVNSATADATNLSSPSWSSTGFTFVQAVNRSFSWIALGK